MTESMKRLCKLTRLLVNPLTCQQISPTLIIDGVRENGYALMRLKHHSVSTYLTITTPS